MSNLEKISNNDLTTLAQAGVIPHGTPEPILKVFLVTCHQHGLSPFKKEIYLVKYGGQYSTIVGIDGMRAKASRTGLFAGRDDAKFDVQPDGSFKTAAQLKAANSKPQTCTITVYRMIGGVRCPFTKTVVFTEYCPANAAQKWGTMPFNMIEKCGEAAVLRMAFAEETAGLNIEEESAAIQDHTIQAAEKAPSVAVDPEALVDRLSDLWNDKDLKLLYGSNPGYAGHAHLFTARHDELVELFASGQISENPENTTK